MKVGFIAPQSIAAVNGGVRTQALFTAKHLQKLGVDIEYISPWDDLSALDIDLFHVFTASSENTGIVARLHEQGKKIVLSPVLYSRRNASSIKRLLSFEEKISAINPGIRSEFGLKKQICSKADLLLPNTEAEAGLISKAFSISTSLIKVIPNGVESRFANSNPELFEEETGLKDFILFAGQASAARKNVESLLKAFRNIDKQLVIIGDFSNSEYSQRCLSLVKENPHMHLLDTLEHDSELLSSAYAACKVFVLPSHFETPGIAAMEAALAGANIVITEAGGTKEYFQHYAEYITPSIINSITQGINKALTKPKSDALRDHILDNYTWDKVAQKTLEQYKEVVS